MRPIAITSIQDVVTYSDLADRTIMLTLPLIRDNRRLTETQIWSEFNRMHSAVLGALLDATAYGLRNLPNVVLEKKPRMADFAVWATACEPALGLPCDFAEAYGDNRTQARETVLAADLVADTLCTFMRKKQKWTGTVAQLLSALGVPGIASGMRKAGPRSRTSCRDDYGKRRHSFARMGSRSPSAVGISPSPIPILPAESLLSVARLRKVWQVTTRCRSSALAH